MKIKSLWYLRAEFSQRDFMLHLLKRKCWFSKFTNQERKKEMQKKQKNKKFTGKIWIEGSNTIRGNSRNSQKLKCNELIFEEREKSTNIGAIRQYTLSEIYFDNTFEILNLNAWNSEMYKIWISKWHQTPEIQTHFTFPNPDWILNR